MKLKLYANYLLTLFFLVTAAGAYAQSCASNSFTDNGGYYGGFEIGQNSFSSSRGKTDLAYGSHHGAYQVTNNSQSSTIMGGGYLPLRPHSGNYFMLIHTDDVRLWYKTVTVEPGATYSFCSWIASAKSAPPSGFPVQLRVKTSASTTVIATATAPVGQWGQICGNYTVPAGVTSIQLQIIDPNSEGQYSNFLALDDICFNKITTPNNPPDTYCLGNFLKDNGGNYGGFEIGKYSMSSLRGKSDYTWGTQQGGYQILNYISNQSSGSGYGDNDDDHKDGDKDDDDDCEEEEDGDDKNCGYFLKMQPHSGSYFMLANIKQHSRIWYKSVTVTPGSTYTFCAWVASAKTEPAAGFPVQLKVKTSSGTTMVASGTATKGQWNQICGTYTVPSNVTSIEIQIVDPNPVGECSRFLALDDICFTPNNNNPPTRINPDINVTYVHVPITGSVRTNDMVPAGTTYGTPSAVSGNPSGSSISMNSGGTYTFTSSNPGVYKYNVPVCAPSQTTGCPTSLLTITVLDRVVKNPPVANTDIANTRTNTPVTINVLANDRPGYPGASLNTSSVMITSNPSSGTVTITTSGQVVYTPNNNFTGTDVFTYKVCDNSSPALCATATVYVHVSATTAANTTAAADDYYTTPMNTVVNGNVKTNDTDPEGHAQTVVSQTTTISGKGTLVLGTNGSFSFTPSNGFTGPVSFQYTTCDNGTPQACANATLYILVTPLTSVINPDINVTYVNVPVSGSVRTNDVVPAGTTYGTPAAFSTNLSGATIIMNNGGTYTFTATTPGVYKYNVPVCNAGQTTGCPTSLLTITVLSPGSNNPPVANTDVANTKVNTAITVNVLANDRAGYPGGSLNTGSVTIISQPSSGTVTVTSSGQVVYTPNNNFTGTDAFTYRVCDNSVPAMCATANAYITVSPSNAVNSTLAADDYYTTSVNTPVSGNVKLNDTDPQGNTQTVNTQNTTISGKGTLVLSSNGNFTFTPVANFTGPVSFPYSLYDNGSPQANASATLYILVTPNSRGNVVNPDINVTYVSVPVNGSVTTNDVVPIGTTYGTPVAYTSNQTGATIIMNNAGTYTFTATTPGVYRYNVPVCAPSQTTNCPTSLLTITVLAPGMKNPPVANTDIAVTNVNTAVTINSLANDKAGYPGGTLNAASVTVVESPLNGVATVNTTTGAITYTPNAGFSGTDVLTYQVCDNTTPTPLCATARQYITVLPNGIVNSTSAADDYFSTGMNTSVSGNVMLNDNDPEGNSQTVVAQPGTVIPGKGTLVLNSNGTFTFTPHAGYSGPVSFTYTTCDNGNPQACANATLYIMVTGNPDLTPRINLNPNNIIGQSTMEITVQVSELKNVPTNGSPIVLYVDKQNMFSNFSFNPAQTTNIAGQPVQNSEFTIDATSNPDFYVITTNAIFRNSLKRVVFTVTVSPGQTKGQTNVNVILEDGSGGENVFINNSSFTTLTFSF